MEIRILSTGPCDQKLINTIQSLADYIGADFKIETRVLLSTDNKQLLNLVDQLTGSKPGIQIEVYKPKSPADQTEKKPEELGKVCRYCKDAFQARRKDQTVCNKPECKKKAQADAQKKWHLSKKTIQGTVPSMEVPADPGPLAGLEQAELRAGFHDSQG